MKFFQSVTSEEEAKKLYRKLAFKYHPDRGGDTETMQQLNREYDDLMERLSRGEKASGKQDAEFDDLDIEVIGSWLWVSGNTYPAKSKLKELSFKWARNKQAWYWHEGEYKRFHKKDFSLDDIKRMHDVKTVKKNSRKRKEVTA